MISESHDHETIRGISQNPIGIEINGINIECNQSGVAIVRGHVNVTIVLGWDRGHMVMLRYGAEGLT